MVVIQLVELQINTPLSLSLSLSLSQMLLKSVSSVAPFPFPVTYSKKGHYALRSHCDSIGLNTLEKKQNYVASYLTTIHAFDNPYTRYNTDNEHDDKTYV